MMSDGYEIRVRHRLGPPVSFLLRDLEPRFGDDVTILWLDGNDQPALQGTLPTMRAAAPSEPLCKTRSFPCSTGPA